MGDLISIIIVNWNGLRWLKNCLDSIKNQTYKNLEIIFVDNASTDKSAEFVKKNYSNVIIIQNKENLGFAEANNIGLTRARGNFIFLLNNDTELEQKCLFTLLQTIKTQYFDIIQPKILLMNDRQKIDNCGLYLTKLFRIYLRGFKKGDSEEYNKAVPVFSTSGAATFFKREVVDKIGFFDKDLWSYFEDVDFCHRAWLAGFKCYYCPEAKIYHAHCGSFSALGPDLIYYYIERNMIVSFLKNLELKNIIKFALIDLFLIPAATLFFIFSSKPRRVGYLFKALWWNIKNIKQTLAKRRRVQSLRQRTDKEIFTINKYA